MAGDIIKSKLDKNLTLHLKQYPRNETKCPLHVIELFPNWFTTKTPRWDYIAYAVLIAVYLSVAIFIVCDDYCVPSLERICYKFKISYAVAGALLLSIATSSPELLVGLYVTFLTEGDMVTDTIAGSSVFNSLAIPSICCLLTKVDYCIDWWPITRDMLWHNVAIFFVALFMHNDLIRWYEALLLVCLHYYYVGHLCMDAVIQNVVRDPTQSSLFECCTKSIYEVKDFFNMEDLQDKEEAFNFLKWPKETWWQKLFWLVSYPWQLLFFLTIPSVRRRCTLNCYILGMFMSICWIAALSYLFTWCLVIIGFNLHVIEPVMRLIVLAVGLSLPEAICGVIVTRKEYGSMAVCCAFGSNNMDICLCLGAPWLIKCLYQSTHSTKYEFYFKSYRSPFTTPGIVIAAIMLYLFLIIKHFEWRPAMGLMCLVEYLLFISMAVIIEQLYGELIKPHCTPMIF